MAYDLSGWLNETPAVKDILMDDGLLFNTKDDGGIYTLPLATVRPTGFFYNSAMWEPSGDVSSMTMEDFLAEISDQKIAFSTAENGWVSALFLTAFIAAEDGGIELLQNGTVTKIVDFNQPAIVEGVTKLQKLLQNNAASNSIGAAYPDAANAFMSGQAALISNGPWMSADFDASASANWSNGFDGAAVHASLFRKISELPIQDATESGGFPRLHRKKKKSLHSRSLSLSTHRKNWKHIFWQRAEMRQSLLIVMISRQNRQRHRYLLI